MTEEMRVPAVPAQSPAGCVVVSRPWLGYAEAHGTALLETPCPDEPEGLIDGRLRADLWRTRILSDPAGMAALMRRKGWLETLRGIVMHAGVPSAVAATLAPAFLHAYLPEPAIPVLILLALLLGLGAVMRTCMHLGDKADALTALLGGLDEGYWPSRLAKVLELAEARGLRLSMELEALRVLVPGNALSWASIPTPDVLDMSSLTANLDRQLGHLQRGASLTLSGASSELVHRACEAVAPGRLDGLVDQLRQPPTVSV